MADVSGRESQVNEPIETKPYEGAAGGWGSLKGISEVFAREMSTPAVLETLARQNKAGGVAPRPVVKMSENRVPLRRRERRERPSGRS